MEFNTQDTTSPSVSPNKWRGSIQLLLGLGLTLLFFFMMAPLMLPILLGAVCAILCYPVYTWCCKKLPEGVSAFVVTIGLTLGILVPIVFMLYSGTYRLIGVVSKLKIIKAGQSVEDLAEQPAIKKLITSIGRIVPMDREWFDSQALDMLQTILEKTSTAIANFLASMPAFFMALIIVIVSTFFFLSDGAKFLKFLTSLAPIKTNRSQELYSAFERSCRGVVIGLFTSSFVQAILMAFFFLITGLPNAALIGLITVVGGMIPLVGSAPIWISAVIYHASNQHWGSMIVMIIGGVLISTVDNIIRPWIMKGHAEMHPLLALVSVFGAINLFGPMGIFLGPVIAAVFVSFLKILALEIRREIIQTV